MRKFNPQHRQRKLAELRKEKARFVDGKGKHRAASSKLAASSTRSSGISP
jgi:hypothetical protein